MHCLGRVVSLKKDGLAYVAYSGDAASKWVKPHFDHIVCKDAESDGVLVLTKHKDLELYDIFMSEHEAVSVRTTREGVGQALVSDVSALMRIGNGRLGPDEGHANRTRRMVARGPRREGWGEGGGGRRRRDQS